MFKALYAVLGPALVALAPWAASGADKLADLVIVGQEIPAPLTDSPGNPARGRLVVRDAGNVTCLICHRLPIPDEPDQGRIGPDLDGVGSRLSAAELRLRLVNPKVLNPDTLMPSYFRSEGLYRVGKAYQGQTIYSAQQIEDVVAYLSSLKAPQP